MAYLQKENVYEVKTILRLPRKLSANLKLRREAANVFVKLHVCKRKKHCCPKRYRENVNHFWNKFNVQNIIIFRIHW